MTSSFPVLSLLCVWGSRWKLCWWQKIQVILNYCGTTCIFCHQHNFCGERKGPFHLKVFLKALIFSQISRLRDRSPSIIQQTQKVDIRPEILFSLFPFPKVQLVLFLFAIRLHTKHALSGSGGFRIIPTPTLEVPLYLHRERAEAKRLQHAWYIWGQWGLSGVQRQRDRETGRYSGSYNS